MKHIKIFENYCGLLKNNNIFERLRDDGSPNSKYYAFDWDDNLMYMPTKIIVKDDGDREVGISTEDFANYRHIIGKEPFYYKGKKIVGFADSPFRYFRAEGDKKFIEDSLTAKRGPSWNDFVEAVNGGSIFAIITARGHNPMVIRQSVKNLILLNSDGIDKEELVKNLKKYRDLTFGLYFSSEEIIDEYLDMCRFYPVTFGQGSSANPEELKVSALEEFSAYVKEISSVINKKAFLKNDIRNLFLPTIGFSDDDLKNVEKVSKHFKDKYDNIIKTYATSGGIKSTYENFLFEKNPCWKGYKQIGTKMKDGKKVPNCVKIKKAKS